MKNRCGFIIFIIVMSLVHSGCKKMLDIDSPKNQLTDEVVFSNEAGLNSALLNLYTGLATVDGNFIPQVSVYTDELSYQGSDAGILEFASGILSPGNTNVSNIWKSYYSIIYQANQIIEELAATAGLSDSLKNAAISEAKAMRAYSYFNLVNTYGEVPLITTTNVETSAVASRASTTAVYAQILNDIKDAADNLPAEYGGEEKVRMNKWAATALLAKVYLYLNDYDKAASASGEVLQSGLYHLAPVSGVFVKNNSETIWQLWNKNGYSNIGTIFNPSSGRPAYTISTQLESSFEPGDLRFSQWTRTVTVSGDTFTYPYKYHNRTTTAGAAAEYTVYFRIAEQYLIHAESETRLSNIEAALQDLNAVRERAELLPIAMPVNQDSCLKLIQKERRAELFAECGNRFFDLKRSGRIDSVLSIIKPGWSADADLYPIPQIERSVNPALSQNRGY